MKISETRLARLNATISKVMEAGEGNKTFLKDGTDALNSLYEGVRDEFHDAHGYEFDAPFGLHQIREAKHSEGFADFWPRVAELVELRNAVKAMPVLTRQPKEETLEAKVCRTLKEEIERRKENFDYAKRAVELLGKFIFNSETERHDVYLPVSTHAVYCRNSFGTSWVRIDWFLDHKKTAFQFIVGAIQVIKEERGIK